jgi:phosphonoacetate hydrolase
MYLPACDRAWEGPSGRGLRRILRLEGIEGVRTREEAARDFHLMPERIGELVVTGDRETVFGELAGDYEALEASYRSHGSLHESDVPLVVYNWKGRLPGTDAFSRNADLLHFLLR